MNHVKPYCLKMTTTVDGVKSGESVHGGYTLLASSSPCHRVSERPSGFDKSWQILKPRYDLCSLLQIRTIIAITNLLLTLTIQDISRS